ncbi:MAG: branched-chain amino acid aminotransferase [Desulfobulbaceae bacterium]|jgi:branched-chain amino acid aminotransferase|nr:branched-chain amino acid aminotransferase [Desulfobulbaceae bacterium]
MWEDLEVTVEKSPEAARKAKPAPDTLGFGKYFTDHMFMMVWNKELGWHDIKIKPYQQFTLDPAAMVFHYGQAIFEGMKAYREEDGQMFLFRPKDNFERMNRSAARLCMPRFPVDKMAQWLKAFVYLERDWVPTAPGSSLYIRPTMIGVTPALGVKPAAEYYFYIIASPVGAYYAEGFNPTRIYVSDEQARAAKGGVGNVKVSGNYAASLYTEEVAKKAGYTQVLWLDACEHRFCEEVGTSNIFFVVGDELITPPLDGTILPGITRDSVIKLAESWGVQVKQRQISIDEVFAASKNGQLQEAFATGTAAVISPVGELAFKDDVYPINNGKVGELAQRLYNELQAIQHGRAADPFKWVVRVG